jgi:hypothetical protein
MTVFVSFQSGTVGAPTLFDIFCRMQDLALPTSALTLRRWKESKSMIGKKWFGYKINHGTKRARSSCWSIFCQAQGPGPVSWIENSFQAQSACSALQMKNRIKSSTKSDAWADATTLPAVALPQLQAGLADACSAIRPFVGSFRAQSAAAWGSITANGAWPSAMCSVTNICAWSAAELQRNALASSPSSRALPTWRATPRQERRVRNT